MDIFHVMESSLTDHGVIKCDINRDYGKLQELNIVMIMAVEYCIIGCRSELLNKVW